MTAREYRLAKIAVAHVRAMLDSGARAKDLIDQSDSQALEGFDCAEIAHRLGIFASDQIVEIRRMLAMEIRTAAKAATKQEERA